MERFSPQLLKEAVVAICPEVASRARYLCRETDEQRLWKTLSTCLLSSQVPYDVALSAADAIDRAGILINRPGRNIEASARAIERILLKPLIVHGHKRYFRFPRSKAAQLARVSHEIHSHSNNLNSLLDEFGDEQIARSWFVAHAPGIGPKQASMFLRDIGFTYELAVLDRHVLNYMLAMQLHTPKTFGSLTSYTICERSLQKHADTIGYPVGLLDWAIWIVMRAARELASSARSSRK